MDNKKEQLLLFVKEYVKNKDLLLRKIERIDDNNDGFFVKYKHKESQFLCEPNLDDKVFDRIGKFKGVTLVCLNTKNNLEFLVKNWKELSKNPHLAIYFTNPKSHTERVWIIFPHIHARIADDESLKLGLETMFSNVEEA